MIKAHIWLNMLLDFCYKDVSMLIKQRCFTANSIKTCTLSKKVKERNIKVFSRRHVASLSVSIRQILTIQGVRVPYNSSITLCLASGQ